MSIQQGNGGNTLGAATVAFGTVINQLAQPMRGQYTRLTGVGYLPGATAHTLTYARAKYKCQAQGVNAAGQKNINIYVAATPSTLNALPYAIGDIAHSPPSGVIATLTPANSMWIAIREADGVTRAYQLDGSAGYTAATGTAYAIITTIANLVAGTQAAGTNLASQFPSDIWFFGLLATTKDPNTGAVDQTSLTVASTQFTFTETTCGIAASNGKDEPLMVQSNNITATGAFTSVSYIYTPN